MQHNVDVHVIRPKDPTQQMSEWFNQCLASLNDEPINLYITDYIHGDIRAARMKGFSQGTADFVSFVDYDDWVEPGIFKTCVDELTKHPHACGCLTLSNRVDVAPDGSERSSLLRPYKPWPFSKPGALIDIHQLVVMRRDVLMSTFKAHYDSVPKVMHEMTWLYWEMAKSYPWIALRDIGYNWRIHRNGAHLAQTKETLQQCRCMGRRVEEIRKHLIHL